MEKIYYVHSDFMFSEFSQKLAEIINSKWGYKAVCVRENLYTWKINVSKKDARYIVRINLQNTKLTILVTDATNYGHVAGMVAGAALGLFMGNSYAIKSVGSAHNTKARHQKKYKDEVECMVISYTKEYFKDKEYKK